MFHPLAPLVAFALALATLLVAYIAAGYAPSPMFEVLTSVAWGLLLAYWVVTDARRRSITPCFDFGFFCYAFLPLVVPGYCVWSRGWRGGLLILTLAVLWLLPYFAAGLAWSALYG
ncbi:MAG: hypothetical protein KDA44_06290 [Planctomycetales bacterium]|nr:hypothetical protein [Planctomycetales bacterium]